MSSLTLVLDLSASLFMGLVDAAGRTLSHRIREGVRGESAHGLLDEVLAEAGTGHQGIADIAVGIGPGSFTGIRVGVALAQGIAFARRLPLYPFSSLAAMLACAPGQGAESAVAVIAANAGRYYAAEGGNESLAGLSDILALAARGAKLVTCGPLPDRVRLTAAFDTLSRLEEIMDFGRVVRLAKSRPPVLDGVVRPNYLMASAAEEKRLAIEGKPVPERGRDADGRTAGSVGGNP